MVFGFLVFICYNGGMLKKSYWIIGVVVIIVLGAVIYWKFGSTDGQNLVTKAKDECPQAKYPFACYLDKAMAANDLNLCAAAGAERVNCLKAFVEIQEVELDCSKLQDIGFRNDCQASLVKPTSQPAPAGNRAASTTPQTIPATNNP